MGNDNSKREVRDRSATSSSGSLSTSKRTSGEHKARRGRTQVCYLACAFVMLNSCFGVFSRSVLGDESLCARDCRINERQ
jgi:hypothetical protein